MAQKESISGRHHRHSSCGQPASFKMSENRPARPPQAGKTRAKKKKKKKRKKKKRKEKTKRPGLVWDRGFSAIHVGLYGFFFFFFFCSQYASA